MPKLNVAIDQNADSCVWSRLKQEAAAYATKEPALSSLIHATILEQANLGGALVNHLSEKLATQEFSTLKTVDINPAARIGHGVMLDHATGFVMGETAVIGNDCSILQGVTLGGTGKADEDRHPKIGDRVLIGANASVLGNIKISNGAKIGAGSVVLKPVSENCIVAGVPAKPVGGPCCDGNPAGTMDQKFGEDL